MFLLKLKQKETVERLTDLNLKKEMNEENGWDCLMFKKRGGVGEWQIEMGRHSEVRRI